MWGDQWQCKKCQWWNFVMRLRCRNCRAPKLEAVKTETAMQILRRSSEDTQ